LQVTRSEAYPKGSLYERQTLHSDRKVQKLQPAMAPTKTLPLDLPHLLGIRQEAPAATVTVVQEPSSSDSDNNSGGGGNGGLSGGAIAGIVIGVIAAILLIWWIVRTMSRPGVPPDADRQGWYDDEPPRRRRSRSASHGHHHHHHHHSHSRSRRSRSPVVVEAKTAYSPARPSAAYVYPDARRASRSRSRSAQRYYAS